LIDYENCLTSAIFGWVTVPNQLILQQRRQDMAQNSSANAIEPTLPSWSHLKALIQYRTEFLQRVSITLEGALVDPESFNTEFEFILPGEADQHGFISTSLGSQRSTGTPTRSQLQQNLHAEGTSTNTVNRRRKNSSRTHTTISRNSTHNTESTLGDSDSDTGSDNSNLPELINNSISEDISDVENIRIVKGSRQATATSNRPIRSSASRVNQIVSNLIDDSSDDNDDSRRQNKN
jgi:hypothetical protein